MNNSSKILLDQCIKVLESNRRGSYTIPSNGLYPHQWLWDSCFTAIGLSHFDEIAAQKELLALRRGQWKNGMLPNMIFADGFRYAIDRFFWDSKRNLDAPKTVSTSGITQPPVLAEAVFQIGKKLSVSERTTWYKKMFPTLINYHHWLYAERDPNNQGILFQVHPYETGLDNTPPWISQLHEHHNPWWLKFVKVLPIDIVINLFRRDFKHAKKSQRISNIDALLYVDIILRLRAKHYLINEIIDDSKYLIEDLSFNCIAIRANKHLKIIADSIGQKLPENLLTSMNKAEKALEELWDDKTCEYYSRNFKTKQLIKESSIAALMPLYSGAISPARANQLVAKLNNKNLFGADYPIPSVPLSSSWFGAEKYWQGPTWINSNWLIIKGLRDFGFNKEAQLVSDKSLELVAKHGSYEYFSPLDGQPLGARNFSWTAALAIDLIKN